MVYLLFHVFVVFFFCSVVFTREVSFRYWNPCNVYAWKSSVNISEKIPIVLAHKTEGTYRQKQWKEHGHAVYPLPVSLLAFCFADKCVDSHLSTINDWPSSNSANNRNNTSSLNLCVISLNVAWTWINCDKIQFPDCWTSLYTDWNVQCNFALFLIDWKRNGNR